MTRDEKLAICQKYMADYPHASKRQLMQATSVGCVYIKEWVEAGLLVFAKRNPRDNFKRG
jgi:hypothetical protein